MSKAQHQLLEKGAQHKDSLELINILSNASINCISRGFLSFDLLWRDGVRRSLDP